MSEELLKLEKLAVFHGSFQALWDVSLVVRSREIVALIGANTSGKSTLLDTISGFLHPGKGSIEFQGKDISRMDPFKRIFPGWILSRSLTWGSPRYRKAEESFPT
jgi:branched-chain amino acid transport system ATP-binding protein